MSVSVSVPVAADDYHEFATMNKSISILHIDKDSSENVK